MMYFKSSRPHALLGVVWSSLRGTLRGADIRGWFVFAGLMAGIFTAAGPAAADEAWQSTLYPAHWEPGYRDRDGRFLHDFSYAGYHMGEKDIPDDPPGPIVDVTHPPYHADPTGNRDSTEAIQQAIDFVGEHGGGVVYLPEGKYRVRPSDDRNEALRIAYRGVVLRGAGPEKTFLYNDQPVMRRKAVIHVRPEEDSANWYTPKPDSETALADDAPNQAKRVQVVAEAVEPFEPGDWIVLRVDATKEFVEEMAAPWLVEHWVGRLAGPAFYRQVTAVEGNEIELDVPLRLPLKRRDNARLYRVAPHLREVGIEHLAIGMREHPGQEGWGFNDYRRRGNAAWDVHGSYAIRARHLVDGWIRRVHTYRPEQNEGPHHTVSNVLVLSQTRNVTVAECDFREAQYRGGGGNGYGYVLQGSDNLVRDCYGEELRYVFDFKSMQTTGNVVLRGRSAGRSDFHMHLSAANLLDNLTMIDDYFYAGSRRTSGTIPHGQSTRDSVFWNTRGEGEEPEHVIEITDQSGDVIIVGTQGRRTQVKGVTDDSHVEGIGAGETLQPQSLYEDQRRRRKSAGNGLGLKTERSDAGEAADRTARRIGGSPQRRARKRERVYRPPAGPDRTSSRAAATKRRRHG